MKKFYSLLAERLLQQSMRKQRLQLQLTRQALVELLLWEQVIIAVCGGR